MIRFLTPTPYCWQFLTTIHQQIWQIFDPSPLKNADVLNGWSQISSFVTLDLKLYHQIIKGQVKNFVTNQTFQANSNLTSKEALKIASSARLAGTVYMIGQ